MIYPFRAQYTVSLRLPLEIILLGTCLPLHSANKQGHNRRHCHNITVWSHYSPDLEIKTNIITIHTPTVSMAGPPPLAHPLSGPYFQAHCIRTPAPTSTLCRPAQNLWMTASLLSKNNLKSSVIWTTRKAPHRVIEGMRSHVNFSTKGRKSTSPTCAWLHISVGCGECICDYEVYIVFIIECQVERFSFLHDI